MVGRIGNMAGRLRRILNLVQSPLDFTTGSWSNYWAGPSSKTAGQTDPFGGAGATQLVLPSFTGSQWPGLFQSGSPATGKPYTVTVWMKGAAGGEQVWLAVGDNNFNGPYTLTTSWALYTYHTAKLTADTRVFEFFTKTQSATIYLYAPRTVQR
jgi:hypothetical protein